MSSSESTTNHRNSAHDISARCAVITCSDTRTPDSDTSGQLICSGLKEAGHDVALYRIIPDDVVAVRRLIDEQVSANIDVILLNGGTGITQRDVTYDVVASMLKKTLPGFGEIFRALSYEEIGAASMLSRAVAGTIDATLVFSMPGSTNAVRLAMSKLIIPEVRHLVWELRR
jgi:molybdopterin adenylyltransferase